MASLPTYAVELPQLDHSGSPSPSFMSTVEQPSPAIPYYSPPIPTTTAGTTPIYGWPLSPWTPPSFPSYSPYSLGLTFQSTPTTFSPYAYNSLPTAVPTRIPSSSSMPIANCARPIDVFGAAPRRPDLETFNKPWEALTSTGCASPAPPPDSLEILGDRAGSSGSGSGSGTVNGGNDLKRRRSPPSEPRAEPMGSRTAPMELAVFENVSPDVAPHKRSRTAQACKRCRIRRARCFGGNPCNRCIKRKFDCEFTSSRQRGPNKPRSPDLPTQNLNLHSNQGQAQAQAQAHQHMQPHAHAQVHYNVPARPVQLARAHPQGHAHSSRPMARRNSVHTANPESSIMPAVPSAFRPMLMHTTAIPQPDTPALGRGLEFNTAIDEDADGQSEPDVGNPCSAAQSASISNPSTLSGCGRGSTVTILSDHTTLSTCYPNMNPGFEIYTPMMVDEMMFTFSPRGAGLSDDADGSYGLPFTPVLLPPPALGSQSTSPVNTPAHEDIMATTSHHGDISSSNASLPSSAMNIDDPMLSDLADHLINVRDEAIRQVYTSDAGEWLTQQPQLLHPPTMQF